MGEGYGRSAANLLTIAEIARRYGLPESTARFYCKRFLGYLPHTGEGKKRRYHPEVMDIFAVILEEMKKRKDARAVEAALSLHYPGRAAGKTQPVPPAAGFGPGGLGELIKSQTKALESVAAALEALAAGQEEAKGLARRVELLEGAVKSLEQRVEGVGAAQEEAEKLHQQDLEQMRKWLGRLAKEQARQA